MAPGRWLRVAPLCGDHCLLRSRAKNNSLDIESHRTTEMIPVLLDDSGKPGFAGAVILLCNAEVLLDLIPDLRNAFVPFNLEFSQLGINLVLAHDPVAHIVHAEEVPVGLAAVSFVGINILGCALSMKTLSHHIGKVIGVMFGSLGNTGR